MGYFMITKLVNLETIIQEFGVRERKKERECKET